MLAASPELSPREIEYYGSYPINQLYLKNFRFSKTGRWYSENETKVIDFQCILNSDFNSSDPGIKLPSHVSLETRRNTKAWLSVKRGLQWTRCCSDCSWHSMQLVTDGSA